MDSRLSVLHWVLGVLGALGALRVHALDVVVDVPVTQAAPASVPVTYPEPTSPAPLAQPRIQSVARKSTGPSPDPWITLSTRYRRKGGVDDFRSVQLASDFVSIDPKAKPTQGKLSLSRTEFEVGASVFQVPGAGGRLSFLIPLNSVKSTNAAVPSGSEFGGLGINYVGTYGPSFRYQAGYTDRKSQKLKLHDPYNELSAGAYLEIRENAGDGVAANVSVGPEFALPIQTKGSPAIVSYGMQWGARAILSAESGHGTDMNFRWAIDAMLRRSTSYSVVGINQGGAGLFSVTPSLDYALLENAWIGLAAEIPVFRPVGRESAFGNIGLPGLYGALVGLRFTAAAL